MKHIKIHNFKKKKLTNDKECIQKTILTKFITSISPAI